MIIEKDYRKWVLFNTTLSDFQNLYELYTSIDTKSNKGGVSFCEEPHESDVRYIVEQSGHNSTLELVGDVQRKGFLEYLVQHYLPNQEIEEWYQTKVGAKEKLDNHSLSKPTTMPRIGPSSEFKIHPKESKYYNIRAFISICFYMILIGVFISSFMSFDIVGVAILPLIIMIIPLFLIIRRISQGIFVGMIKGSSVKLNEHQYPEIFEIVRDQAKQLGLTDIPEIYLSHGRFNAFVTKLARKKYLMLYSEVIETASKGDFEIVKFVVGHELGHLKRRHLSHNAWLFPSSLIPFLRMAHSRACEYTCDRIGYHFSKQGSIEGILILATGKEVHSKIDVSQYIEDADAENSFWVWFSEFFLSHPYTFKRLSAISKYDQRGY